MYSLNLCWVVIKNIFSDIDTGAGVCTQNKVYSLNKYQSVCTISSASVEWF